MILVTERQRCNALEAAFDVWPSVPPANLSAEILRPSCLRVPPGVQSLLTFFEWMLWWPRFREQVVLGNRIEVRGTGILSVPAMPTAAGISDHLFGSATLAAEPDISEWHLTVHEMYAARLAWLLEHTQCA